ncbi:MAG: ParA family protein [Clostridia bacterium]|nr:ParA family protein [Clostridia bacterium]
MQIVTVAIQKGGTGKTTTAATLAQAAAYKNKKVLAIDLDPQGNLSFCLGATGQARFTSYDLITASAAPRILKTPCGADLIPSAWELSNLKSEKGSARRLQTAIKNYFSKGYDFIIIDTPPTAGELQYNALQASTDLIIPLAADIYNLQSLYQITAAARQIQQSNKSLRIAGIVITKADTRSTIARQMREQIIETAANDNIPCLGIIRTGIAIQEAAALQKSIYEYAPNSNPAQDYLSLLDQITR